MRRREYPSNLQAMQPSLLQVNSSMISSDDHHGFWSNLIQTSLAQGDLEEMDRSIPKVYPSGPVMSCNHFGSNSGTHEYESLKKALGSICNRPDYAPLMKVWLEPGFENNYLNWYGSDGWVDDAFVTYFALHSGPTKGSFLQEMDVLFQSVQNFSSKPIIAVNFGLHPAPSEWSAARLPHVVVLRAVPLKNVSSYTRFNFNKFRAMTFARVRTGMVLDADQFVVRGVDNLFDRTKEEVTEKYPYPILPVHWMSRDNDPKFPHPYSAYDFECKSCTKMPRRTMRWGHAHPTWTYWALPFVTTWLRKVLDREPLGGDMDMGKLEDEDVLNLGLWSANATKQWCKFDVPGPSVYAPYMTKNAEALLACCRYEDPKWYPAGIPIVFYTDHGAKVPTETLNILRAYDSSNVLPPPIFYNGSFFASGLQLRKAHPELRCII